MGAIAGYAAAAVIVLDMLKLVNQASAIINTGGTVILGLVGFAMDASSRGGSLAELDALPDVAYTPPGA